MQPKTIGNIDSWAGRPICLALTAFRRFARVAGLERKPEGPPRKILFLKLIEQGATVQAYGALRRAAELVGRENLYFCVFDENREILDLLGIVPPENVLEIRRHKFGGFVFDSLRALWRVRRLRIDATLDLESFARAPAIFAYLCGARRRVGLHRFTSEALYRGDLMTHRVFYNPYLHCAQFFESLVMALERDAEETPLLKAPVEPADAERPRFEPTKAEREAVRELLVRELGQTMAGRRIVLLNPNAGDMLPIRRWPQERFVSLGKAILARHEDVAIVVTGAPNERDTAERVCQAIGSERSASLAGKTTLRELLVLYTLADVLVTNDSGPGHFASLTDIDTVVLFGPETPRVFSPLGSRTHVIWKGLACSPCVSALNYRFSPCNDNVCMQMIGVDEVYAAVERCLAARNAQAK